MPDLKIVADDKIPLLDELYGTLATITRKPGQIISARDVQNADILLIRSITYATAELLQNSSVSFVGTLTSGIDHLDTNWLNQTNIHWAHTKGANAKTVAEYVASCIAALSKTVLPATRPLHTGVIGVGYVGRMVVSMLEQLGHSVVTHDPPRALIDASFISNPLDQFTDLDLICIHTPLTTSGHYPTYHLINEQWLKRLKPGCVLMNAGRGAVIDSQAALAYNHLHYCFDVWENEPEINLELLSKATIATAHIAGYSQQAKWRASMMMYQHIKKLFDLPDIQNTKLNSSILALPDTLKLSDHWQTQVLAHCDPFAFTTQMRNHLNEHTENISTAFEHLRRQYPLRQEIDTQSG